MATKARDAFRTISEVADWLDVPAHVLRFWESKFSQIKPVKRAGGRRYYRPDDMELIGGIKRLLHDDGMTIRGVQKMLKEDGVKSVAALSPSLDSVDDAASPRTIERKAAVPDVTDPVAESDGSEETQRDIPTDDEQTLAEWEADQAADTPAPTAPEERAPLNIAAPSAEDTQAKDAAPAPPLEDTAEEAVEVETVEEEVEEAPYIDVAEEPVQIGGDNVVSLSDHAEADPAPEPEPEPELEPEPEPEPEKEEAEAPKPTPAPVIRETTLPPPTKPAPATVADTREKTLPPPVSPPPAPVAPQVAAAPPTPEPAKDTSEEGFKLTASQAKTLALKTLLRRNGAEKLDADAAALAPKLAQLQALRDKIAAAPKG